MIWAEGGAPMSRWQATGARDVRQETAGGSLGAPVKRGRVAELQGEDPNLVNDLFSQLADWEDILRALLDFPVDDEAGGP